jgi:hypothetical protein
MAPALVCKDRWRQVLREAQRIWPKHHITLEPAISTAQTDQMQEERLQLVVPTLIRTSYSPQQQSTILNLADFINLVLERTLSRDHSA